MENPAQFGFSFDPHNMSDDDYHQAWDSLGRIEIRLVEKLGKCRHEVGETYYYETPYKKPINVCNALLHVLDLYTWRVALGFPSWNDQDRLVHRIHCPDHTGTVWEVRRVEK